MRAFQIEDGLSDDDRLTELAIIFAAAILRLHQRSALESSPERLEVLPEIRLSVSHGG